MSISRHGPCINLQGKNNRCRTCTGSGMKKERPLFSPSQCGSTVKPSKCTGQTNSASLDPQINSAQSRAASLNYRLTITPFKLTPTAPLPTNARKYSWTACLYMRPITSPITRLRQNRFPEPIRSLQFTVNANEIVAFAPTG